MDFRLPSTDQLLLYGLLSCALIAITSGCIMSSFKTMLMVYGIGVFLLLLIFIPDWPYFYRHPREWMQPKRLESSSSIISQSRAELLRSSSFDSKGHR
ncbi:hypothetical protein O6H91_03G014200 [Diphasiastrum complanatum]|uniref:Uncharacterized protein n=1 Tax=Diphasiastrum complanatum TaxID=34168 RepID=A0ACC2E3N6_DIPCM|nr:hypothetical protein O6H91_Y183700 [Diphasiastrum complanatum]KAJ7561108.1 hypothetical protein O6H91_03G014200 [Diphasiastrum complanatum]